jgi:TPR repeat protein
MANYENMSIGEVQRLAKQGDGDALYEMAWRPEAKPSDIPSNDPVYNCAWQDFWWGKAADSGHADARDRYARSLVNDRPFDSEWRQKAMGYFETQIKDFDAGKLKGDLEINGILALMQLGILLCQGLGTRRDATAGDSLLKKADSLTNGFAKFGYEALSKLAQTYGQGCLQANGEPSVDDLRQAISYQRKAVERFNPEKNDPNNRGILGVAKEYLEKLEQWKQAKESLKDSIYALGGGGSSSGTDECEGFKEWQRGMMQISPVSQQRIKADKDALAHIRQCMTRAGW